MTEFGCSLDFASRDEERSPNVLRGYKNDKVANQCR